MTFWAPPLSLGLMGPHSGDSDAPWPAESDPLCAPFWRIGHTHHLHLLIRSGDLRADPEVFFYDEEEGGGEMPSRRLSVLLSELKVLPR